MRRRPRPTRLPSREEIRRNAEGGLFDRNPLLAASHEVQCKHCGCRRRVIFLEHLRSGHFELGKTEMVEVFHAAPTPTGLHRTVENITPLIIRIKCNKCEAETSYSPLSLEYLLFTTTTKERRGLYI